MEDADLIQQVLSGEHEKYSILVERYQEPLIHFLRSIMGTDEEVFDCAQEAFLAAYRNLWRYSQAYSFRSWLYTIARNKAIDLIRKRKRESSVPIKENLVDSNPGPEETFLAKEEAQDVQEILKELPDHYKQALFLRYQQELSYEEISTVLDIPLSSVKNYLHRGKGRLRKIMERRKNHE